jgi:hypothetical protein
MAPPPLLLPVAAVVTSRLSCANYSSFFELVKCFCKPLAISAGSDPAADMESEPFTIAISKGKLIQILVIDRDFVRMVGLDFSGAGTLRAIRAQQSGNRGVFNPERPFNSIWELI